MSELRYTQDHEWVRLEGGIITVGITDYAQQQLGDVVHVELPAVGKRVEKEGEAAVVESVKAASEVYAPLSGEIVEVNEVLSTAPQTVNESPTGEGWFIKMRIDDPSAVAALMDEATYKAFVEAQG